MTQVRLQLEELSFKFSESTDSSYTDIKIPDNKVMQMLLERHYSTMSEMLTHKYSTVDQRLERVEALLQNQAMQMHTADPVGESRILVPPRHLLVPDCPIQFGV